VHVDHPSDIDLPRPYRGHLPVQNGHGGEIREHHVAHAGVTPTEDGVVLVVGPMLLDPFERVLDQRGAHAVRRHPVVVGPLLLYVVPEVALAVVRRGQEPSRTVRRQFVQRRQRLDRLTFQALLILHIGVEEPVAAVRVGHQVGRDEAMDPLHHEERHPDGVGARLQPEDLGDWDLGMVGHHLHGLELTLHVVDHEDRVRRGVGRDARHQLAGRGLPRHGEIEEHRL